MSIDLPPPKVIKSELSTLQSGQSSDVSSEEDDSSGSVVIRVNRARSQYMPSSPPYPPPENAPRVLAPANVNSDPLTLKQATAISQRNLNLECAKPDTASAVPEKESHQEPNKESSEDEEGQQSDKVAVADMSAINGPANRISEANGS